MENYDFSGYATRNDVLCSDGRVIRKGAFKAQDGAKVPLVWGHQHGDITNVLGHAILENREDGVYAYGTFNNTPNGQYAKQQVEHGDITAMSIFANQLKQDKNNVIHGVIREVSLVLAGANPEAFIENVIKHGETVEDEIVFYTGEPLELHHSDGESAEEVAEATVDEEDLSHADSDDSKTETASDDKEEKSDDAKRTIGDVINTFNDEQKKVFFGVLGQAISEKEKSNESEAESTETTENTENNEGGTDTMKHNVFDQEETKKDNVLSHDAISTIIGDAKRFGSMRESVLQHAETYGINQIDYLFPDEKNVTNTPIFIQRDTGWVSKVMSAIHHTPFSRIKSLFADITEDEARAKGYLKGNLKKEEVFSLLKRATTPTTVYKKQKMDRDDVVDITDFDVIAWLKTEMRMMLNEELARAYLFGDGRLASSDDKINEGNIRPIWKDDALFTIKARFKVSASATDDDKARAFIRTVIKARKNYKGSGNPTLFTTEDILTDCLLLTDANGRDLYESVDKLAQKLRVKEIVTVPVMENLTREDSGVNYELYGLIVNLTDYNVGADKGGSVNMFEDFDIDYNQQKYLIETRCSGALIKPFSAIAVELNLSENIA